MFIHNARSLAAAVLIAFGTRHLGAQTTTVAPGTRIRLQLLGPDSMSLVGWIQRIDADTLRLWGWAPSPLSTEQRGQRARPVRWDVLTGEIQTMEVRYA